MTTRIIDRVIDYGTFASMATSGVALGLEKEMVSLGGFVAYAGLRTLEGLRRTQGPRDPAADFFTFFGGGLLGLGIGGDSLEQRAASIASGLAYGAIASVLYASNKKTRSTRAS